jgi:segregation and condensation protein A
MSEYRVELDSYDGPLDLLLYLIRRDEVDIYDIPIASVTKQYVHFVDVLKALDPNLAGDFLVMLATLIEIKSRALLPRHLAVEEEEEFEDPRMELVRQLLAYKAFKDAANELNLAEQVHKLRYVRQPVAPPTEPGELDLEDVSVWTLMQAFGSLLEQIGKGKPTHDVVYDDTPISLHAADIVDSLTHSGGSQLFETIFTGRGKAEMIGLFLALLELIKQSRIRITQEKQFATITIHLLEPETDSPESEQEPLDDPT